MCWSCIGFSAYVPVQLLREFSPAMFAGLLGFAAGILALAWFVFRIGMGRYESGKLVLMRD